MVWQVLQSSLFLGTDWRTKVAQIPQSEIVSTHRESVLRFLELLRREVTGTRSLSMPPGSNPLSSLAEKELIEGLALEVYLDHYEEAWVVAPERFFKEPGSQPPSRLSSSSHLPTFPTLPL